jgi:cytochrome oxidase Cu insertion factor (SCO1/SenC/PrrC family)
MVAFLFLVALPVCGGEALGPAGKQTADSRALERPELQIGRSQQYDYDPPTPGTYDLPKIKIAGDGAVIHLNGQPDRLREVIKDRISILSFIYTRCADPTACPYATGVLYKIHSISQQDDALSKNLRLVTFSFDPDHDSPRILADYSVALRKQSGAEWLFLTTAGQKQLTPILTAYGQRVDKKKDATDPNGPFSHVLRVYLIDRQGMIRNIYSTGMLDPRVVLSDVRTLLLEEAADRRSAK